MQLFLQLINFLRNFSSKLDFMAALQFEGNICRTVSTFFFQPIQVYDEQSMPIPHQL